MKSIIILVILVIQCFVSGDSQEYWYKNQIVTNILPSYTQAYDTLQAGILSELLAANVTSLEEAAIGELVNRLYCSVQKTHASLEQSVSASENLQVEVNTRLTNSLTQAGVYEQSITNLQTSIIQTDESLKSALSQLAAAEQAVLEKQNAVAVADQAVRDAEEEVEKARKCRGKRSWLGRITRPIVRPVENFYKNVYIKPICSVINSGGIDNAKGRRGNAEQQLASARNQEQHFRQVVAEKQTMKAKLEEQLRQLRTSLTETRSALQTLQNELSVTINITQKLKEVTTQLNNVLTGSSVLQNTITHLIDFELLINPLNAIYAAIHQITDLQTIERINQEEIDQTKASLKEIALILPNMPYNLNSNFTC